MQASNDRNDGKIWVTAIESLRLGGTHKAERKQLAQEAKRAMQAQQVIRRGRIKDFDSLSPVAQAAWDGRLIAGRAFLTFAHKNVAQWGGDREAFIARLRQLLELGEEHSPTMALESAMCRFDIVAGAGAGAESFRRPNRAGIRELLSLSPGAAIDC